MSILLVAEEIKVFIIEVWSLLFYRNLQKEVGKQTWEGN